MFRRDISIKRVIIITGRTDLRKGIDGLSAIIRLNYDLNPLDVGTLFLFCGVKKDRIKALLFEGDGYTVLYKRLTVGRYAWPASASEARDLSMEDYDRLLQGFAIESTIK